MTFACQCPVPSTGTRVCVCRACHGAPWGIHVFTSVTAFDAHQRRRRGQRGPRACRDPAECGLELKERAGYLAWGEPGAIDPAFVQRHSL